MSPENIQHSVDAEREAFARWKTLQRVANELSTELRAHIALYRDTHKSKRKAMLPQIQMLWLQLRGASKLMEIYRSEAERANETLCRALALMAQRSGERIPDEFQDASQSPLL